MEGGVGGRLFEGVFWGGGEGVERGGEQTAGTGNGGRLLLWSVAHPQVFLATYNYKPSPVPAFLLHK